MSLPELAPCPRCSAPVVQPHRTVACDGYRRRAELRADGWAALHPVAGYDASRQRALAELWPETTAAPDVRLVVGGFGVRDEDVVEGTWVRSGTHTEATISAASILHRRDRIGRSAAARQALGLADHELDAVFRLDGVIVPATACGGHRLELRDGGLRAFDHENPAPRTRCRVLLDAWATGAGPVTTIDFVRGSPPFYERTSDPVPELTRVRRLLAIATRQRLLERFAPDHPWLADRLRIGIGGVHQPAVSSWAGRVPMLWVTVPPSWPRRPTEVDLPLP